MWVFAITDGREVVDGTAWAMFAKASQMSPAMLTRGPLRDGHAAAGVADWMTG